MASRNRAHALVNIICNPTEPENMASTSHTPVSVLVKNVLTEPHSFERIESRLGEILLTADNDLIQLEDLVALDSPSLLETPSPRPTSLPPVRDACEDFSPDDDSDYEPPNDRGALSSDSENIPPNEETLQTNEEVVHFGDMFEGRRRQRLAQPESWKKSITKRLRMEGKEYVGYKRPKGEKVQSQIRNQRVLGPKCSSDFCRNSKLRCCDEVGDDDREKIFRQFWSNMDWHQRKVYVANNITFQEKGRQTSINSRRAGTFVYFLPVTNSVDGTTTKKRVCREMFIQTLCIGTFSVQNWAKKE
ncbi:unnamed protein product [Parnassius apollo]|uniref:(apollo) hypothetical protein n=1 Tax=Parnassius apollo TaxID=110799 RepID=A0A8S3WGM7_PARAO|nr:unnamed protein product [Parnassius apollo]